MTGAALVSSSVANVAEPVVMVGVKPKLSFCAVMAFAAVRITVSCPAPVGVPKLKVGADEPPC